jgi:DNA-binding NtrC family response regulator
VVEVLLFDFGIPPSDFRLCLSSRFEIRNTGLDGLDLLNSERPGILVFDQFCPEVLEWVSRASRDGANRILAITTSLEIKAQELWALLRAGASDVLRRSETEDMVARITSRLERWREIDHLIASPPVSDSLIGGSVAWISTLRQIVETACYTDSPLLLAGESGTGKERVARIIHELDRRPQKGRFVVLDCTTITPELSGSEFFGHERGSFTGASIAREGAFHLANGGTLFLDEVGELPLPLQAELLRVVQEGTYKPLGSNNWQHTRFRLISATNRDLEVEEAQGRFRRDLYYRIAGSVCRLPGVEQRVEDILPLARHFLAETFGCRDCPSLDPVVIQYLLSRSYPGNVRDLKQLVLQIAFRHVGPGPITPGDIPITERPDPASPECAWCQNDFHQAVYRAVSMGVGLKEITVAAAESAVRLALDQENGNLRRAARRLGVTERALQLRRANRKTEAPELRVIDGAGANGKGAHPA